MNELTNVFLDVYQDRCVTVCEYLHLLNKYTTRLQADDLRMPVVDRGKQLRNEDYYKIAVKEIVRHKLMLPSN